MRDDFSIQAKEVLAKRVNYHCSNPKCDKRTTGPNTDPAKAITIGVAAHISAASQGGPRYDSSLTSSARRSAENGIWLCQSCSRLIDTDAIRYPTPKLLEWKQRAEGKALAELEGELRGSHTSSYLQSILLIFVLLLGAFTLGNTLPAMRRGITPSIIILPFKSECPRHEYLAASLPDEIADRLMSLRRLRVLPTTSQVDAQDLQQMKKWGVDYILEGTVRCKLNDRAIHIIARLIRTINGTTIEAGGTTNIDQMISTTQEIAESTTDWLTSLRRDGQKPTPPTTNSNAYQAYLRGLACNPADKETLGRKVRWFEKAVLIDSRFALAYARLSQAHTAMYENGYDRAEERLMHARQAFTRSLDLDPGNSQGRLAKGYYLFVTGAFELALEELRDAGRNLPNKRILIRMMQGFSEWSLGRPYKAVKYLEDASALDPKNSVTSWNLGNLYSEIRRFEDADLCYKSSIAVSPDIPDFYRARSLNYLRWKGSASGARSLLPQRLDWSSPDSTLYLVRLDLLEKKYQDALQRLNRITDSALTNYTAFAPKDFLLAEVYHLNGDEEVARPLYRRALSYIQRQLSENPEDARIHSASGLIHAALHQKDDAVREGKLGVTLCDDAALEPYRLFDLASIYLVVGEKEEALEQLKLLLSIPSPLSVALLRTDPRWDALRGEPEFERLMITSHRSLREQTGS
jgi:tetratricopeptide (TPR) repeat protein